jgi:hypothetical protein
LQNAQCEKEANYQLKYEKIKWQNNLNFQQINSLR